MPAKTRQAVFNLFWAGGGLFALGFAVWNVDNIFCGPITYGKYSVGWPAAFLLEGHSWWHILTGVGTYLMIQGVTCARRSQINVRFDKLTYGTDLALTSS